MVDIKVLFIFLIIFLFKRMTLHISGDEPYSVPAVQLPNACSPHPWG